MSKLSEKFKEFEKQKEEKYPKHPPKAPPKKKPLVVLGVASSESAEVDKWLKPKPKVEPEPEPIKESEMDDAYYEAIAKSSEFRRFEYFIRTGKVHRGSLKQLDKDLSEWQKNIEMFNTIYPKIERNPELIRELKSNEQFLRQKAKFNSSNISINKEALKPPK